MYRLLRENYGQFYRPTTGSFRDRLSPVHHRSERSIQQYFEPSSEHEKTANWELGWLTVNQKRDHLTCSKDSFNLLQRKSHDF